MGKLEAATATHSVALGGYDKSVRSRHAMLMIRWGSYNRSRVEIPQGGKDRPDDCLASE